MKSKLAAILLLTVVSHAYAETVWLSGKVKDEEGKTICVYKSGFDKIYIPAEIGDYCEMTINK